MRDGVPADKLTEKAIRSRLYAPDMPDPDVVVRTSGEHRISNFLLWEMAYSELIFTDVLWPDFRREHLFDASASSSAASGGSAASRASRGSDRHRRRPRHRYGGADGVVPGRRDRPAHPQAGRVGPHRQRPDARTRQGAGGGQGRPQDEVALRRPPRAAHPRAAAALRGPGARHHHAGRDGRPLPRHPRRPRPPHPGRLDAGGGRSARASRASPTRRSTRCCWARCGRWPATAARSWCRRSS